MFDPRVRTLAAASALVLGACVDRGAARHGPGRGAAAPTAETAAEAGPCSRDADCHRTGCSGEVCAGEDRVTSCLWRPEYACYGEPFARCACTAGACGWAADPSLAACVAHARGH